MNVSGCTSFFPQERSTKKELVAAQFSIEGCAEANVVLPEN